VAERLYRSRTDRSVAGVAGGLAAWLGVDPTLVRVAWVLLAILSSGVFLVIYVVMAIVVPEAPDGWAPRAAGSGAPGGPWTSGPWTGGASPTSWPPDWQQQHEAPRSGIGTERAGIVAGLFLVLLGAWFLIDEYLHVDWAIVWPVAVIAAGVALIVEAARRGR
jgi:phage shock protein PspC (stress-responsive transcriptional regulator)